MCQGVCRSADSLSETFLLDGSLGPFMHYSWCLALKQGHFSVELAIKPYLVVLPSPRTT